MAQATFYRDDQTSISVTMDGVLFPNWDAWTGGNLEADTVKYRTLQAGEIDLGGVSSRGDLTITVQSSDVVIAQWLPAFERANGKRKATAALKFLDADGAVQHQVIRTGTVKAPNMADMDRSSSSPGRHTFSIVLSLDEIGA